MLDFNKKIEDVFRNIPDEKWVGSDKENEFYNKQNLYMPMSKCVFNALIKSNEWMLIILKNGDQYAFEACIPTLENGTIIFSRWGKKLATIDDVIWVGVRKYDFKRFSNEVFFETLKEELKKEIIVKDGIPVEYPKAKIPVEFLLNDHLELKSYKSGTCGHPAEGTFRYYREVIYTKKEGSIWDTLRKEILYFQKPFTYCTYEHKCFEIKNNCLYIND